MPKLDDFPFTKEKIVELAGRLPTPFHLYDERTIVGQVRNLNAAFSWCAGYRNYFAVKATPNPYILHLLKNEGCGMDCSSVTELVLSEKTGFKTDEIMFTSNNTPIKEFAKAKSLGAIINFDDLSHVKYLDKEIGLPEMVSFRYNPGPGRTGNVLIGDPKEAKFGFTEDQLLEGYKQAKEMGVNRFGLHTMVVSNCLKASELMETARMLFNLVEKINKKLGIRIEMVNLGGGFGIPYKPEEKVIDVQAVGDGIHKLYKELIEKKNLGPIRIVTECGRYVTGPGGFLVSRVIHRKRIYKNYVGIDACMANLMRPGMYGAYHHISVFQDTKQYQLPSRTEQAIDNKKDYIVRKKGVYDVVGGLCENNDKFAIDRPLDPEPLPGDIVVIHDSGAHGHSMGFNYNGKPRSAEYLYREDGSILEIRRAETMQDLFATLDFHGAAAFGSKSPVERLLHQLGGLVASVCLPCK